LALILVLHPDDDLRTAIRSQLEDEGHWTLGASSISYAKERLLSHRPDVALIAADGNPETTNRVLESFKKAPRRRRLPIILLWDGPSSGTEVPMSPHADALLAIRPLVADELLKSVTALLESPPGRSGARFLRYGHLELDQDTRTARLGSDVAAGIPEKHFLLLWFLAKRAAESNELCPREIILSRLWRNKVRDREVDVTVSRLKTRLPFLAAFIESVPRRGYRLVLPTLLHQKP